MASGGRHFKGAFHGFLTFDIGIVQVEFILLRVELFSGIYKDRLRRTLVCQEIDDFDDVLHAIDVEIVHHRRLALVLFGDDKSLEFFRPCPDGNWQRAFYRLQTSVETEFSDKHKLRQMSFFNLFVGGENADSNREVECGAFFSQVGRCEIDSDTPCGISQSVDGDGREDAALRFSHSLVSQSREEEFLSHDGADLNSHRCHLQSVDCRAICLY